MKTDREILEEILERIKHLESRKIPTRKSPSISLINNEDAKNTVINSMIRQVRTNWRTQESPTELSSLGRRFGKRCNKLGGWDLVLESFEKSQQISRIDKLSGAIVYVPLEIFAKLSFEEIESIQETGLDEKTIQRFKNRKKSMTQTDIKASEAEMIRFQKEMEDSEKKEPVNES